MTGVEQHVEEADTCGPQVGVDHLDPRPGDPQPVPCRDRAGVAGRVAHGLGDLAGHHVAGGVGHGRGVALEPGLGVVGEEGGEALAHTPGRHDGDGLGRLRVHLLGHRDDVLVVGEDHDLVGGARLDRGQEISRRRVHGLATRDHALDAEAVEDPLDAVAHGDGDHGGGDGLGGVRGLLDGPAAGNAIQDPSLLVEALDLLEEVGDADLLRPTGVDGGLDGGPDVVGVDVAVPDAVATDHDDGIPDAGPHVLERRDRLVGCLEEVHHLVAEVADTVGAGRGLPVRHDRAVVGRDRRLGDASAVDDVEQDVEQQQEPAPARIDHPRLLQDRQQLGRVGEGLRSPPAGGVQHVDEGAAGIGRRPRPRSPTRG